MNDAQTTAKKPAVTFWIEFIGDRSVKIESGQSILDAALKAGISHYHDCGGNGECSTCRVLVQSGAENLTAPSEKEQALRQSIPLARNVRLACQTQVAASPVRVHRIVRDDHDLQLYTGASRNDVENAGHEHELALFFLDIRDFTPFMEAYLPFDVIHIMRRLFGLFREQIEKHHGRIVDTAGDGFYAVFGFDTNVAVAANQAYAAAVGIQQSLHLFNEHYAAKYFFHHFQVGIGLHAGRVIVGNIGIGVNENLTVMGLPVNIAARIQTNTRTLNNNLVVSEHFYDLLQPAPPCEKVTVHLKGIKNDYALRLCGTPFVETSLSQPPSAD